MIESIGIVLALCLFGLALNLFLREKPASGRELYCAIEKSHMPREIADGRLILSEQLLRVNSPARIVAKPDQVYLCHGDVLVPVENKTRRANRVYDGDRVELSVQAFALRHAPPRQLRRYSVASYGYVAVRIGNASPVFHRVDLLPDQAVVALRQRRIDVEAGAVVPSGPAHRGACSTCSKRSVCPRWDWGRSLPSRRMHRSLRN